MKPSRYGSIALALLVLGGPVAGWAAEETVATAVYAKIGNGYKREKAKDGSFKPEYYALSNGGRIDGTTRDLTVDRVTYPEVAEIATRLLAQQRYHYAKSKDQAKLLLVLQWGSTLAPNGMHKDANVADTGVARDRVVRLGGELKEQLMLDGMSEAEAETIVATTKAGQGRSMHEATNLELAVAAAAGAVESQMLRTMVDNRVRDELNQRNARVLGYQDDLAGANDIRRYAGGGDRYSDLIADVEESRYYIVVSAYDFPELLKTQKQKLLWQVRVSVRTPGNAFDDSLAAMLKSAAPYFGQNSGKLVRGEETKGTVELGELKFLGEAKAQKKTPTKEEK